MPCYPSKLIFTARKTYVWSGALFVLFCLLGTTGAEAAGYGIGGLQLNRGDGLFEVVAAIWEPVSYLPALLALGLLVGLQVTLVAKRRRMKRRPTEKPVGLTAVRDR
jgi:hypothetical protein